mgnify:CR=1 FL=1
MKDQNQGERSHPFPPTRPDISIVESTEKIDQIDCRELRWWFAIPLLGDHTLWASYDANTLELESVTDMMATVPTRIHQVDCTEIQINKWSRAKGWAIADSIVYGKIERKETRWIAVITKREGKKVFSTFLDEGFHIDWGGCGPRKLYDDGRYQLQADGSYKITNGKGLGAGVYDITIGVNKFRCLRVLDPDPSVSERGELVEAYLESEGRTVLLRGFNSRFWGKGRTDWSEKYPRNARIIIDACMYVHSDCTGRAHDIITNTALAVHPWL